MTDHKTNEEHHNNRGTPIWTREKSLVKHAHHTNYANTGKSLKPQQIIQTSSNHTHILYSNVYMCLHVCVCVVPGNFMKNELAKRDRVYFSH